ncbi:MAG TPA: ATP-dependent RNA helicase RhlB [Gammaproteobacteria bacterium]|nr:ATP-dependent RNA helicase RhlB [Gammaproteobacteria bacterium]
MIKNLLQSILGLFSSRPNTSTTTTEPDADATPAISASSTAHLTDTRFDSFNLPKSVLQGLRDAGFERCTPIQAESLPLALTGQDIAGQAQTGTGKTIAFLLAVYNRLLTQPAASSRRINQPRALILAPTRELAIQIHKDAKVVGRHTGLRLGLIYGGTDYDKQRQQLTDGVDILIGTPGRLIDFFEQKVFDLKAVQSLVLDEADRMFDLGFIKDIRFLMRRCPPPTQRQGMLFSATLSYRVQELAYEHMNNPQHVAIEAEKRTADKVDERIYFPSNDEKIPLLLGLLHEQQPVRSIIFVNTKRAADKIYNWLRGNDYACALLSGDIPQARRQSLLHHFQTGEFNILVATDVAARGLHIPEVSHVFNFDLPQMAEDYVHRVGRTARAGASGSALSFACEDYAQMLPEIEEYIGHSIQRYPFADLLITPKPPARSEFKDPGARVQPRPRSGPHKSGDRKPTSRRPHKPANKSHSR